MRKLDVATPHFTDRVDQAQQLMASRDDTPALADADRELLRDTLRGLGRGIGERGGVEQLLHGEPHPCNVLTTKNGLLFIDLETCCRGPWNSTSPMRPKKSASTIRVSIVACCASAGSSCWR
jgi:Ser/Thr protein kinase RdoA (MazF antagonist)